MRAFISLYPGIGAANELLKAQSEFRDLLGEKEAYKIKWETADKFHITMFFIGEIDNNKAKDICGDFKKISGNITGKILCESSCLSAFPNTKNPRVIICEAKNKDGRIFRLNDIILNTLSKYGLKQDKKFHPHITLGRVKRDRNADIDCIEDVKFSLRFEIEEMLLMESVLKSEGAIHTVIEKFKL
ncbi:MAG: RNA 2',3'-cyclic phosphodiesterase [Ignavibacteria bacterium]|nr:RNA 2',3'-cyclic phosphodiesterase [Ignavibacteria bacterium]